MCTSNSSKGSTVVDSSSNSSSQSHLNGRPVLQPNRNQLPLLERRHSFHISPKKTTSAQLQPLISSPPPTANYKNGAKIKHVATTPPISPKTKNIEKMVSPKTSELVKKSKASVVILEAPGRIAAARREQVAIMQVQRKAKIAHYGRTKSAKFDGKVSALEFSSSPPQEKRCTFITPNSDPLFVKYHDEEWGVSVHDDNLLFELLVLTVAQVGSDWTCVLKKRQDFRDAFSGFDAEIVSKYNEKKITSTSADYGIELSQVRGAVDNSNRILQIKKEFGSFSKYLWGFVNNKPIATQYKACNRIPVKTSKSETISKDMVKRGFRYVGPTVVHSFMQAAGLTNDHLTTCLRHLQCSAALENSQPCN